MKIIITENKLRDLQLQYLNRSIGSTSDYDNFIIIYYPNGHDDDYDSEIMMEYDSEDGRLYIDKSFLDNFAKVYVPKEEDAPFIIKDWFDNYFGVDIKYIQT
jgi:hypothetical protein